MTNEDIRKNKIDYYKSKLKESYYNSSYLPEILGVQYVGNPQKLEERITEIPIHERDLLSNTKEPAHPITKEGEELAQKEIDYLPKELHLLMKYLHLRNQNYFIVPKKLHTYMLRNSKDWRFETDKGSGNSILKICDPPVIVIPSESITDEICIINSSYGNVDYYSTNGKDKRFIVDHIDTKFNVKIIGTLWLKIDLHPEADTALFKLPDSLLESF